MSNISLELNFELYQHLVDIYNMPRDDYAARYVFDAGLAGQEYGGEYYAYNNNNVLLSEKAVMSILFSKFYSDKDLNIYNQDYVNYMLKENYSSYIDYSGDIQVSYYEDNMVYIPKDAKQNTEKAYVNSKIVDFDISSYASYNIRYYLLYLDIISQIYKFAYERKKNKQPLVVDAISIEGRYAIQTGSSQLQRCDKFSIILKPVIQGIDNKVIDIQYTADKNISNAFVTFKSDIMKHLRYLSGEDVRLTGLTYLKTIEYFYKFCRLRLMYLTTHCIRLLDDPIGIVRSKFNTFILDEVLAVFTNFRDFINKEIFQSENLKATKNMLYNTRVLDTSTKLQDINDQIIANRDKILNNQSFLANIDVEYTNAYRVHLTATVVLFVIVLIVIIMAMIQVNSQLKANVSLVITFVLTTFIMILYIMLNIRNANVVETFVDNLQVEKEAIRFPRAILVGNKTRYTDGTVVNVKSSNTSSGCVYAIFNNEKNRTAFGSTCATGWTDASTKKWVAIDLGEYVYITSFKIIVDDYEKTSTAPKNIILYGSAFMNAYTTPFDANGINKNWVAIQSKELSFPGSPYNNNLIREDVLVDNDATSKAYPYYMLVINSVQNNGSTVKIKYWELSGVRNYKTSQVITDTISSVEIGDITKEFTAKSLPYDYDDNKLISWDLTLTAKERSSECISLSIGTFCFNNNTRLQINNQTSALDPYGAQYITGIVEVKNKSLSDVGYSLIVRYYPTVIDAEQLAKTGQFDTIDQAIADVQRQRDQANTALQSTSNVLMSSNLKIEDYLQGITDSIRTSNNILEIKRYETTYLQLQSIYNASNATLNDLLGKEQILREKQNEYGITSNLNAQLSNTFTQMKGNIMNSINYFRGFMTASERSLADAIDAQITIGNVEKIKIDISRLANVGQRRLDVLTCNIVLQEAEVRKNEAASKAEISLKASSTSFLNSEAYELELETTRKTAAIASSEAIFTDLGVKVSNEISRKEAASAQFEEAKTQTAGAQASGNDLLNAMNNKYNTRYASLDELNNALNDKLKSEKALKAAALQEYSDVEYQRRITEHKLNSANTMISFYDGLAAQTNTAIAVYDGYVDEFNQRLQYLNNEKAALQETLDRKTQDAQDKIDAANRAYADIENITLQEILLLKVQHSTLLRDIAKRRSDEGEAYKEFLQKRKEKDTAREKFDAVVRKKQAEESSRDYYKSVRDAIKENVDVSIVINDIDVSIVYSITDSINGINYDLITPNMSSEYYQFDKYRKNIQLSAHQSEFDINDKLLNIRAMEAKTVLFLNLSIIIILCVTAYYYFSSQLAVVIAIAAIMIAILMYSVKIRGPVRSRARNYYWN